MTDFHQLCQRMADELDHYRQLLTDDRCAVHLLAAEARAALAAFTPPADGEAEVEELAQWLEDLGDDYDDLYRQPSAIIRPQLARAAALLREARLQPVPVATPGEQYHEDMGPVLWWRFPIEEPPYVGTPNDSDWPGYHTHYTPVAIPTPTEPTTEQP